MTDSFNNYRKYDVSERVKGLFGCILGGTHRGLLLKAPEDLLLLLLQLVAELLLGPLLLLLQETQLPQLLASAQEER